MKLAVRRHAMQGIDIKYSTARIAPASRPARSMKASRSPAAASSPSSTPTSSRSRTSCCARSTTSPIRRWPSSGALGPHQRGLLAADEDPGGAPRRALRARARQPQPRRLLLQLQRHDRHLAPRTIYDGGGWQHDTLTEDLDLSYRTQLKGWQFVFLPDHVAPANCRWR